MERPTHDRRAHDARAQADPVFRSLLTSPDRERIPSAPLVLSRAEQDEASFLAAVDSAEGERHALLRRGIHHGEWVELDPLLLEPSLRTAALRDEATAMTASAWQHEISRRWHATRPIYLPGIVDPALDLYADEIAQAALTHRQLMEVGGLRAWIGERALALDGAFQTLSRAPRLADPERDIERVGFDALGSAVERGRHADLWAKSAWLSTHEDDASLRLRFSFGREGGDDASLDIERHRRIADLAERLLPESVAASGEGPLRTLIERFAGEPVLFTQSIAYWNAPGGGALFHHDAFSEDDLEGGAWRQLGVCFVQLSGRTAWLALSLEDLARRVLEFMTLLDAGELPWVRVQLFERGEAASRGGFTRAFELVRDEERCLRELALPGCGTLAELVNRGPEFTSFLADGGHALVLRAGDALLLPNQGLHATCMHSVFCAGDETGYALSLALRPDREAPAVLSARARPGRARKFAGDDDAARASGAHARG